MYKIYFQSGPAFSWTKNTQNLFGGTEDDGREVEIKRSWFMVTLLLKGKKWDNGVLKLPNRG